MKPKRAPKGSIDGVLLVRMSKELRTRLDRAAREARRVIPKVPAVSSGYVDNAIRVSFPDGDE